MKRNALNQGPEQNMQTRYCHRHKGRTTDENDRSERTGWSAVSNQRRCVLRSITQTEWQQSVSHRTQRVAPQMSLPYNAFITTTWPAPSGQRSGNPDRSYVKCGRPNAQKLLNIIVVMLNFAFLDLPSAFSGFLVAQPAVYPFVYKCCLQPPPVPCVSEHRHEALPLGLHATLFATTCLGAFPFRYTCTPGFTLPIRFAKLKGIRFTTNRLWNL